MLILYSDFKRFNYIGLFCRTLHNRLCCSLVWVIGWEIGVGRLLAMQFKIYRRYKNDENREVILIKNMPILIRVQQLLE